MANRGFTALGVAAGAVAAVAGTAYTAQRVAAGRLRRRDDPDHDTDLVPAFDEIRSLPSPDGGAISVISRGTGPTIVLSHGVTLSVRTWVKQMESLPEAGFRTVAFDHRGHGASRVGASGHALDTLADDMRCVLDGLDLTDAVLVGHSMGGVAAQLFCLRHPDVAAHRLAGIVLLSTLSRTAISGNRHLRRALEPLAELTLDASGAMRARNLGLLIARLGFGKDPQPSHVELTRQMILGCDPVTRKEAPSALLGLDLTRELASIRMRTLVICGTNDVITPPAESRRIARRIPGARLELLPGAGHMLMLERSETVDDLVVHFAHEVQTAHRGAPGREATG
jgi:pimeloyl-ACP methyl ester carboxylesterase